MNKIGFMQGRLSPPSAPDIIQEFPSANWQNEYSDAAKIGFRTIEWTLDFDGLERNPLMNTGGREEIKALCSKYHIEVASITGDCFMQAPFWKANGRQKRYLVQMLEGVVNVMPAVGAKILVVPLVDNGTIKSRQESMSVLEVCQNLAPDLRANGCQIAFETDFEPKRAASFISMFPADICGINYDIGNSASLGFNVSEEFAAYGERIVNVHVKDRSLGGSTVPLGEGNAQLDVTFKILSEARYAGNYILQTARALDGDHKGVLKTYLDITRRYLDQYEPRTSG